MTPAVSRAEFARLLASGELFERYAAMQARLEQLAGVEQEMRATLRNIAPIGSGEYRPGTCAGGRDVLGWVQTLERLRDGRS